MRTVHEIQRQEKVNYPTAVKIQRSETRKVAIEKSLNYSMIGNKNQDPLFVEVLRKAFADGYEKALYDILSANYKAIANCNDCGRKFIREELGVLWESAQIGVYYDGDPICGNCAEKHYENKYAEWEAENI